MKTIYSKVLIGLIASGAITMAGTVTIPNSFTANTTAKAAEVNDNFTAVKTAVDGNAGDIETNATSIATHETNITANANNIATHEANITTNANNILTNQTAIGNNENDIATNANDISANQTAINSKVDTVTTGGGIEATRTGNDVEIKRASGHISINPLDLALYGDRHDSACALFSYSNKAFWGTASTSDNCIAFTGVHLPDGAKVTELACYLYNNDSSQTLGAYVYFDRRPMNGVSTGTMASVKASVDIDSVQYIVDNTIYHSDIDNGSYTYYLYFDAAHTSDSGQDQRFVSCSIAYEY